MKNTQTLSILDLEQMSPEEIKAVLSKKESKDEESEVARDSKIRATDHSHNESFFIDRHDDCKDDFLRRYARRAEAKSDDCGDGDGGGGGGD